MKALPTQMSTIASLRLFLIVIQRPALHSIYISVPFCSPTASDARSSKLLSKLTLFFSKNCNVWAHFARVCQFLTYSFSKWRANCVFFFHTLLFQTLVFTVSACNNSGMVSNVSKIVFILFVIFFRNVYAVAGRLFRIFSCSMTVRSVYLGHFLIIVIDCVSHFNSFPVVRSLRYFVVTF